MECSFEGIEQTSGENGVVWVVYVHHIKGDVFSSCILEDAKGY
jgi:hypothetical protein